MATATAAGQEGISLNKLVLLRLCNAAAGDDASNREQNADLDDLAGTWNPEEVTAVETAIAQQQQVDPSLWA